MILARYMLSQFFPPFLFGLALFSGVLLLDKLFDLMDLLINKGVSIAVSAKMLMLFMPTVLSLSVPMSILLACLLTFGRLSEDNEITAMRASGLSFPQILWLPFLTAVLISVLMIPFNAVLAPKAINGFRNLYHTLLTSDPLVKIEPKQFIKLQNFHIFVRSVGKDRKSLSDIWLYQLFQDHVQRIYAKQGSARISEDNFSLSLQDGQIERISYVTPKDLMHIQFATYDVSIPFLSTEKQRGRSWREFSVPELRLEIQKRKETGNTSGEVEAEMHLRFAIAFSPLALALLGIPLGIALERGGRGVGFGASIGVLFMYYLLLIMGLNLAEKNVLPALPALWIANTAMLALGAFLYRKRLMR
ncbi:MAG: LptF/LptG family permease [Elusimicrobia bacterium]|nr:LptF/LptG family permease [Elusimicrobiota bacterium]